MPNKFLNIKNKNRIILIAVAFLVLLILFLTVKKVFFLLTFAGASIIVSLIIRFVQPMKIVGIELVTFSTILIGSLFGSFVGAIFGVCLLVIHLIAGNYSGGPYLLWIFPEYIAIGILCGFLTDVKILVVMIVGINLLNIILTMNLYRENSGNHLIFSIGNMVFNSILILNFFNLIINSIV